MSILAKIKSPKDLRALHLSKSAEKELAQEIRDTMIATVSKNGGHLASSLGVVELTIALHTVFDTPRDKIVWDVGHQSYAHKLLTGRLAAFKTLRQFKGLSGFPKRAESIYDTFDVGHSSTSLSAALGMARARDLKGDNYSVVAVIGDGALTGGMALEALNDIAANKTDLIIVLNDNEMSIEKNDGGMSLLLTKLRSRKSYCNSNRRIRTAIAKIPHIGEPLVKAVHRFKYSIKQMLIANMIFEDMGIKYLGPVDAHDINTLVSILRNAKDLEGPVLIHCISKKGKGYRYAENDPNRFHGVTPFNIADGKALKVSEKDYSAVFGESLCEIAAKNPKVIAITAAMCTGTGLTAFKAKFPDRFFDVEIAEQHALTLAAGLAVSGMIPVVPLYSSFMQRAYDQLIHDIALQKLHVVICLDRAGLVGADGETHQGIFDLAYLNAVPGIIVAAPKDFAELKVMLKWAVNSVKGPVILRYPRGKEEHRFPLIPDDIERQLSSYQAERLNKGHDLRIIALGKMVYRAQEVSAELAKYNYHAAVINARFLKPFDVATIFQDLGKDETIVTIEDGVLTGGLYTSVLRSLNELNLTNHVLAFGIKDTFVPQGSIAELEQLCGLDKAFITEQIVTYLKTKQQQ